MTRPLTKRRALLAGRLVARSSFVVALLLAAQASAQVPAADLEHVWLDAAGRGSLLVGTGQTLRQKDFRLGAALSYTNGNFKSFRETAPVPLLSDRFGAQVFAAVGVFRWLELSAAVPVYFSQRAAPELQVASAGLGNPWLHAKIGLLDATKLLSFSVGLGVGVPVGTAVAQGNGGVEFLPRATVGKVFKNFQVGLELGGLVRPTVDFAPVTGQAADRVGSQLYVAAMLGGINLKGPRGEVSLRGFAPLTGGQPGLEGQLGVRWLLGDVELFASVGPGFWGAPATPSLRSYAGMAFANVGLTRPPCIEGEDYDLPTCPDLDRDGDGVKNQVDLAPLEREDLDGFEDQDGKPEADNDQDGVLDLADACVNVRGLVENKGCPDVDSDKDGLVDRLDGCPEPEDFDGFEDGDGCPEPDNDKDGVLDAEDRCPLVAGVPEEHGCPVKDADADGVPDFQDNCPQEKGVAANSGCPESKKQLVQLSRERLAILDKVYFDTGKATIQKKSFPLLDQVAQVLVAHPELARVQVEGHTDNQGKPEKNKQLSQERADAVKAYLAQKGVDAGRLVAVGFGQEKPSVPNDTPQGREANRRVEFNLPKAP